MTTPSASTVAVDLPDVVGLGVSDVAALLDSGRTTSVKVVEAYLARIAAYEESYDDQPGVNAVIAVNKAALAEAAALDAERANGTVRGPLHGVPIIVKDNYDVAGMPTTAGTVALADFRPADDSAQVARLRAAGAIVLAKGNMDEFAWGFYGLSTVGGQTNNPYDQTRIPGGSSGGSAAGVAASFAAAGMGSDTCGSIRIAAAYQNLVGMLGTNGLSSRDGIVPLSATTDMGGPLTQSVTDMALMLDATVGYDAADPITADSDGHIPSTYTSALSETALSGTRIGLLTNENYLGTRDVEQPTTAVIREAVAELERQGAEVVEIQLPQQLITALGGGFLSTPEFRDALNTYLRQDGATFPAHIAALTAPTDELTLSDINATGLVLASAQASNVAAQDAAAGSGDSARANRALAQQLMLDVLDGNDVDALVYPSMKRTPWQIGTPRERSNCQPASNTGFPAITVPAGFADNLPVGMEFMGRPWSESTLLGFAYDFEQATAHDVPPAGLPELAKDAIEPVELTVGTRVGSVRDDVTVDVRVGGAAPPTGTITVASGQTVLTSTEITASGTGAAGASSVTRSLRVPGRRLGAGRTTLTIAFTPASGSPTGASVTRRTVSLDRARVTGHVGAVHGLVLGRRAIVRVVLDRAAGIAPHGRVLLTTRGGVRVGIADVRPSGARFVAVIRTGTLHRAGILVAEYRPSAATDDLRRTRITSPKLRVGR